jgi:hypothetical protein
VFLPKVVARFAPLLSGLDLGSKSFAGAGLLLAKTIRAIEFAVVERVTVALDAAFRQRQSSAQTNQPLVDELH